jgi:hypothetical protein
MQEEELKLKRAAEEQRMKEEARLAKEKEKE